MARPSTRKTRRFRWAALFAVALFAAMAFAGGAAAMTDGAGTAPSIATDQADYAPGSLVTLNGAGWAGDDSVAVSVNDNQGQTWSWSGTATPDANGNFSVTLTLPTYFVATYTVSAMGTPSGATATTSFTDGSVSVNGVSPAAGSFTYTVAATGYSDPACTLNGGSTNSATYNSNSETALSARPKLSDGHTNADYVKLSAGASSSDGRSFTGWNSGGTTDICVAWPASASVTETAHYGAPADTTPPSVTINQAAAQTDPTSASPINFTVAFSESVGDFATGDVTLSGTAGATTATVTGSGPNYNVAVSGMTSSGTVIASIAAGVAHDAANNGNTASIATDDTVTYNQPDTANPANGLISINGGNAWTNSTSVSVSISATDNVGIASYRLAQSQAGLGAAAPVAVSPASTSFSASNIAFTLSGGDGTAKAAWVRFCDAASNCIDASNTIGLDTVKPKITGSTGSYVPGTWTNQSVTVSFTCADDQGTPNSGVDLNTVAGDTLTASGENQSVTNTGTCTDKAGNTAESVTVSNLDIDKVKPVITAAAKNAGNTTYIADTWTNQSVTVSFSCSDTGSVKSGVSGEPLAIAGGGTQSTETSAGSFTSTGSCTDAAGNVAEAATFGPIKVDKTNPSVSVAGFTNGQTFTLADTLPTPSCSRSDLLSGIDNSGNTGPTLTADTRDSNGIGSVTYTCGARDNADNTNSASATFSVGYATCLLYDVSKSYKAGSVAPLKLFLCDGSGNDLSNSGITVQAISLTKKDNSASAVLDDAGASNSPDFNFRYDATLGPRGGYIFNLSTKQPPLGSKSPLSTGTYLLTFKVDGASNSAYTLQFDVK